MTTWSARAVSRRRINGFLIYVLLVAVAIALFMPIVWLLVSSLKTEEAYISYPIKFLPDVAHWKNYVFAVTYIPFGKYAGQSALLAASFGTLTVLTSSMAGYAFSRIRAPGSNALFVIVMGMLMVPNIVTTIPQFIVFSRVGINNTYWPWVLWGIAGSPFHIFLFRQFFSSIPRQLEEAAEVDGCTELRIWWQIFLPNSLPVLATSFMFNFSWAWGDWFNPVIYLDEDKTTLAVKLTRGYTDPQGFALVMPTLAAAVIYTLPLIAMFFIGQKYIIQGVVTSGIKG